MTGHRPPLSHPAVLAATWFGIGRLRPAPGTWGSAAALPFAFLIAWAAGPLWLVPACIAVTALGYWAASRHAALGGEADAGEIVIDEVAGQWLTLAFLPPDILAYILGFALFRAADVLKPFPAGYIDRRLKGPAGVMGDDLVAGVYAGVVSLALLHLTGLAGA